MFIHNLVANTYCYKMSRRIPIVKKQDLKAPIIILK